MKQLVLRSKNLWENLYLVGDNSEHKKANDVNKNVVATISHNEYKDVC